MYGPRLQEVIDISASRPGVWAYERQPFAESTLANWRSPSAIPDQYADWIEQERQPSGAWVRVMACKGKPCDMTTAALRREQARAYSGDR